jgi:hypothetical protein
MGFWLWCSEIGLLQNLKTETKKKSKQGNDIEYETVERHIKEVEEAVCLFYVYV